MKKFLFLLSAILMIGTSATAGVVKTYDDAGTPMSFSDFVALSGTGKHFGLMAVSDNDATYKKWFGFTSATSRVYDLTKAQLFTLSGATDNYTVTRVSDNTAAQSGLKLVNRTPGDQAAEYTSAMDISFDNASGSHFNANSYAFAGGTGGWSAYVAYGPFYVATIEIQDVDGNVLQAATEQIVTEGYVPTVANRTYVSGSSVNADGTYTFVFSKEDEAAKRQNELNALIATVEAAYAANSVGQPGANLITANSQFSSNATESSEGSLSNLLDGNLNSYWHSQWSAGNQPMHKHYLQVALTEAIDGTIQMTMGRRSGAANDHPVKMSVEYSVDGSEPYTLLDGQFMEFSATTGYVTGTFNLATAAKYLRFFNDDSNGTNDRGYWHCSEFQLNKMGASLNETYPTDAANMLAALNAAKAITSGATQANIDALQTAFNTYKNAAAPTYTVTINGATDGKVIYNSTQYGDGETFKAADLAATDVTALALDGYKSSLSINGTSIIVTYYELLKTNQLYVLSTKNRGAWVVDGEDFKSTASAGVGKDIDTADEYQQFAIYEYEGAYYLWNEGAQHFINNAGKVVGIQEASPIAWTEQDGGTYFFRFTDAEGKYINLNGSKAMDICSWSYADEGNMMHLTSVEGFDAAAVAAVINADLSEKTYTVTVTGTTDGRLIYNSTEYANGTTFKASSLTSTELSAKEVDGYKGSVSMSGTAINVVYTPYTFDKTKTYTIRDLADNRGYIAYNPASDANVGLADVTLAPSYAALHASSSDPAVGIKWTITEDAEGVTFYCQKNKKYIAASGNKAVWSDTPAKFTYVQNTDGTFSFMLDGNTSKYLHPSCGWSATAGPVLYEGYEKCCNFTVAEVEPDVEKSYAYVLNDAEGNKYEGTYTASTENARPTIAGCEGLIFSNEKWEDGTYDVDYVYTADIEFPFPVNTPTFIYAFLKDNFQWQAAGSDITVQKDVTGNGEEFRWTIVPAYDEEKGAFSFTIKNNAGSYITTSATGRSHEQGTVTFGTIGTPLVWASGAFKLANQGLYLSVNSSNVADLQYLGVWDSAHNGTKLKFVEYVPTTTIDITIGTTGYATIAYMETFVNKPEGLKVYYCTEGATPASLNTVEWDKDYIPGYCAYILEGTPGTYTLDCVDSDTFEFPDTDYDAVADIYMYGLLYGNFDNTDITVEDAKADYGENIYVFSKKNEVLGFYQFAGATLAAHKAFFATKEASVQGFTLDFGGQTVGVNSVISAANLKAGYDIQGRMINKIQKGINVINGKKIIK